MKLSESDCILFRFDLPDASSGLFRTQIMLGRGKKGQCHRIALDREGLRGTVRSPAPSCQWAARNRNIDISMRGFQVHNEGVSEGFPGFPGFPSNDEKMKISQKRQEVCRKLEIEGQGPAG